MLKLDIHSTKAKEIIDITKIVNDLLMKNGFDNGVVYLFVSHTTCGLTTADLDPGTDQDYLDALEAMFPKLTYRHPHDPSHVGDHIMASLVGPDLAVPVSSASMVLGAWQKTVLIELNGPKERHIQLIFLPEPRI